MLHALDCIADRGGIPIHLTADFLIRETGLLETYNCDGSGNEDRDIALIIQKIGHRDPECLVDIMHYDCGLVGPRVRAHRRIRAFPDPSGILPERGKSPDESRSPIDPAPIEEVSRGRIAEQFADKLIALLGGRRRILPP